MSNQTTTGTPSSPLILPFAAISISSRTQTPTYLTPLLTLPPELLRHILSLLSWRDLTHLRLTHRSFTHFLPSSSLPHLHATHQNLTWAAELSHRHTTLGYTNAHWTGFSQGWGLSLSSLSDTLPCYHCLRWLPSADMDLSTSAFSRGMATRERDLGMAKARSRVCVECGVRSGFYARGTRVRNQVVCYGCGGLGQRIRRPGHRDERQEVEGGLLKGRELRWHHFCAGCVEAGRVPERRLVFEHWRRWGRYEEHMVAGRRYRLEEGRRIRKERGIEHRAVDGDLDFGSESEGGIGWPKHWCPFMEEKRICQCWKWNEGQKPAWALMVENSPWIW